MHDYQQYFEKLFKVQKIDKMLELGLGDGTELLLKNCKEVCSIELLHYRSDIDWYNECRSKFRGYRNWKPDLFECEDELNDKLKKYLVSFLKGKNFDFIFVDPGLNCRADLVNFLFGKADIIAAHDTSTGKEDYKWDTVKVPEDYHTVEFANGQGTTFWIKDLDLVEKLLG